MVDSNSSIHLFVFYSSFLRVLKAVLEVFLEYFTRFLDHFLLLSEMYCLQKHTIHLLN